MGNHIGPPSRLSLHKKKTGHSRSEREIAVIDDKIEDIVNGLYGITYEEQK